MRIVDNTILTPREREIALGILYGKNKKEIAKSLSLSISTVKTCVEHIYQKMNVHNKAEFIVYLIKNKIADIEIEE